MRSTPTGPAACIDVTVNSAARAREQGWTAAKVLALLHNRLGVEPPADLTLKLRGWLGDFGAAQQATMRLVRLPDPSLWRVVEPAAAGGVVARVGPAMAVVDEAALALIAEALAAHGVRLEATTPATAAGPLLGARRDEAAPLAGHDLQTLRGKPLREFLQSAATNKRDVTFMHQAANQRSPKRHTVTPRYVDHRMNGYYLVATTEAGTDRAFKLDDIFGVALEEGQWALTGPENPLIVQADRTVLLEVNNPRYEAARDALAAFAELERSPEHVHTYRITPLSLWNAAAAGHDETAMLGSLREFSKYDLPANLVADVQDYAARYGRLRLVREGDGLALEADDSLHHYRACNIADTSSPSSCGRCRRHRLQVRADRRGHLKQALVEIGYPAQDLAGYVSGAGLRWSRCGMSHSAADHSACATTKRARWMSSGRAAAAHGGSGAMVLPCGAGKTMVGLGHAVAAAGPDADPLLRHDRRSPVDRRDAGQDDARPDRHRRVHRRPEGGPAGDGDNLPDPDLPPAQAERRERWRPEYPHLDLFTSRDWGLIIYDEVHLLPAPVFRITAEIQARRRLGLTATLVREDGREKDVFSLIGPKKFDLAWRVLEKQGWIARPSAGRCGWRCRRNDGWPTPWPRTATRSIASPPRTRRNSPCCAGCWRCTRDDNVLIIGQYLDQIEPIAAELDAPLITGKTRQPRSANGCTTTSGTGRVKRLVVSKVANFAIDLPEANVAIQVSGTFGSRQEEAQRLGRVLRPKADGGRPTSTPSSPATPTTRTSPPSANSS